MSSEKKCLGCGVLLQDENILQEGYTTSIENDICQRCFRMKNYGEYQVVTKSNEEYINILKGVSETKDLVLYITDLINLEKNLEQIRNFRLFNATEPKISLRINPNIEKQEIEKAQQLVLQRKK